MNEFPLILAGPIVRRTEPQAVSVWLALRSARRVELLVFDDRQGLGPTVLEGSRSTVRLGEHLHVVCVTSRPTRQPLEDGRTYVYGLRFHHDSGIEDLYDEGVLLHDIDGASLLDRLVYEGERLPSFRLPPRELRHVRIAHGSCRKPHGGGSDALALLDAELTAAFAGGAAGPIHQQLFLTGDQIYADDVDPALLAALVTVGEHVIGPDPEKRELEQFAPLLQPGRREPLIREHAALTTGCGSSHLVTLSEYCMMYLFAFSDVVWPAEGLDALAGFRASLKHVRRVLANVSTYMVFDDHEITDDWYRTRAWVRRVTSTELGTRIIRNGLVAHALFQHWGNDPAAFAEATPGGGLLAAVDGWDGTAEVEHAARARAVRTHIHIPAGTGELEPLPPNAIHWHYAVDTPAYRVVALDTRTRRTFRDDGSPPGLMSPAALADAFPAGAPTRPLTIVLSPAPVLGVKLVEFIQRHLGRLVDWVRGTSSAVSGSDAFDAETWSLDEATHVELLRRLSGLRRVLVLSGDVHYGFGATLHAKNTDLHVINFVSSALKNEVFADTASEFLNAFRWSRGGLESVAVVTDEAPEEVVHGERQIGGQAFEEVVLPNEEEENESMGLESTWGRQAFPASVRLRGILGSANVGDVRFRDGKVEHRLLRGRKAQLHVATLDVVEEVGELESAGAATRPRW